MYLSELRDAIKSKLLVSDVTVNYRFEFSGNIYELNNVYEQDDKIIITLDDNLKNDMIDKLLFADDDLIVCVLIGGALYDNVKIDSVSVLQNTITLSNVEYDVVARLFL